MTLSSPLVHMTTVHTRRDVRIFLKEAQSLRELGRDVVLIVADGLGDEPAGPHGVRFVDIGRPKNRLVRAARGTTRVFQEVRKLKPAIVHFHDPELIPVGIALKALGYTVIYDVHEDVPQQILTKHWIPGPLRWTVSKAVAGIEFLAKRSFDAFVTATPHIASKFPPARAIAIQNYPIPDELLPAQAGDYRARPPHVVYAGGVTEQRGGRKMVEAMGLVSSRLPDATLAWAGLFVPAAYETELRRLQGWQAVDYHGLIDRTALAELFGSARAGLVVFQPSPNHIESQPNKLFEYMAAGLPVVASDFPLWREIVEKAGCGLLVDPEKPAAIADAITWLLEHPDAAEAMGRRGQVAVNEIYNWPSEAKKLTNLYRTLLSNRSH